MKLSAPLAIVLALGPVAAGAQHIETQAMPAMPAMIAMPAAAPAPTPRPMPRTQAKPAMPVIPKIAPMPVIGADKLAIAELMDEMKQLGSEDLLRAELKAKALDLDGVKMAIEKTKIALEDMKLDIKINTNIDSKMNMRMDLDAQSNAVQMSEDARARLEDARRRADEAGVRAAEAALFAQDKALTTTITRLGSGDSAYNNGLQLLNSRRFDMAIQQFDRVIAQKEARADGAMYHKAFAQSRSGRMQEALDTIAGLRKEYPQSRYLADAKVLEADVRRMAGQPINLAAGDDDEIKVLAISGLQKSGQAIPLLEGVLAAANSLRVKKQALFVLASNDDARARAILLRHAKGDGNPDLQMESIRLLVSRRDGQTTNQDLRDIYASTQDVGVRMSIIDAYRSASDKPSLIAIAGNKTAPAELRGRSISSLSEIATPDELWTLYQSETEAALRAQMASTFASMRAIDQLTRIARTDADMSVRRRAISGLGGLRGESATKSRQALVDLYTSQTDTNVKTSIINALNNTESAEALVSLARKETSLELKRELVRRISDLAPRSKPAADYLMEVIK